jgi:hypothetical protein
MLRGPTHMLIPPVKMAIAVPVVSRYFLLRWLCTTHIRQALMLQRPCWQCDCNRPCQHSRFRRIRQARRCACIPTHWETGLDTHNMFEKSIATFCSSLLYRICVVRLDRTARWFQGWTAAGVDGAADTTMQKGKSLETRVLAWWRK